MSSDPENDLNTYVFRAVDHASVPAADSDVTWQAAAAQIYATLAVAAAIDKLAHAIDQATIGD